MTNSIQIIKTSLLISLSEHPDVIKQYIKESGKSSVLVRELPSLSKLDPIILIEAALELYLDRSIGEWELEYLLSIQELSEEFHEAAEESELEALVILVDPVIGYGINRANASLALAVFRESLPIMIDQWVPCYDRSKYRRKV